MRDTLVQETYHVHSHVMGRLWLVTTPVGASMSQEKLFDKHIDPLTNSISCLEAKAIWGVIHKALYQSRGLPRVNVNVHNNLYFLLKGHKGHTNTILNSSSIVTKHPFQLD